MLFAVLLVSLVISDRVDIREPRQRLVMNTAELQRLCASGEHVFACTLFPEEWLEGRCVEHDSLWYDVLTAHLAPQMILGRPHDALHEWLHIEDLRRHLEQYVMESGLVAYASASDCRLSADARISSFHDTMSGFRRESNERYH